MMKDFLMFLDNNLILLTICLVVKNKRSLSAKICRIITFNYSLSKIMKRIDSEKDFKKWKISKNKVFFLNLNSEMASEFHRIPNPALLCTLNDDGDLLGN